MPIINEYFKVLYITHFEKVYTTCYMILRNHALAEEVTQETFMSAYEKIDTLRDPGKFSSWVGSIAANKAVSLCQRNKKVIPINEEAILDYFEKKNANQTDPADVVVTNELISEVKTAISQLKPEMKEIIVMKYYLDLEDWEIGKYLEKPVGTVKSTLYRAKKVLAKVLSKQQEFSQKGRDHIGRA